MSGEDGAGAVELLGEDEAGEGMSQSKGSKGEQELSPRAGTIGPSAGRAHCKNDVLSALIAALASQLAKASDGIWRPLLSRRTTSVGVRPGRRSIHSKSASSERKDEALQG